MDLQLALAEAIDELGLPVPIMDDLLPLEMSDLGNGAAPASAGDLGKALVRSVGDLLRARIQEE